MKYLDGISRRTNFYELRRQPNECWINAYNPILLTHWDANMDIQLVGSTLGMAYYLTTYICKPESHANLHQTLSSTLQSLPPDSSVRKSLFKIAGTVFSQRKVSLQEAILLLSDYPLRYLSRAVQYLDLRPPLERIFIANPSHKDTDDNDDIEFHQPAHFNHYINRPASLSNISLFQFISSYSYSSTKKSTNSIELLHEDGYITPRARSACIKWPKISLASDKDNYFYYLLLLHLPYRCECELLIPYSSYYHSFNCHKTDLHIPDNNNEQYRVLTGMLQMSDMVSQSYLEELATQFAPASHEFCQDDQITPTDSITIDDCTIDLPTIQNECMSDNQFQNILNSLNTTQTNVYRQVHEHVQGMVHHITGQRPSPPLPIYLFITGAAGTGKTLLLNAIRQLLLRAFPGNGACVISAPTGVAAYNIGACTMHKAYHLPVQHCSYTHKPVFSKLSDEKLHEFRNLYLNVHYNIIDEISMVSYQNFLNIHARMNEILTPNSTNKIFGNTSVICFGDLMQLRPVMARFIFEDLKGESDTTEVHLWRSNFVMIELQQNMRQCDDSSFAELCHHFRFGNQTPDDLQILKSRILLPNQLLEPPFQNAIRIFPTNKKCDVYNEQQLQKLPNILEIPAQDIIISSNVYPSGLRAPNIVIPPDDKDCAGLSKILKLAVGAEIMLRRNLDTKSGLVNGAKGIVTKICTDNNLIAQAIFVKFHNTHVGLPYQDSQQNIKIEPVVAEYYGLNETVLSRKQFPLTLSYAVTIHRCQGLTLDAAVIDLGKDLFQPCMAYVAISRLRSLHTLAITELCPTAPGFRTSAKALDEMERLRQNLH